MNDSDLNEKLRSLEGSQPRGRMSDLFRKVVSRAEAVVGWKWLLAIALGVSAIVFAAAIAMSGRAKEPLEICVDAKMAVWDDENPDGVEMRPYCGNNASPFQCAIDAEKGIVPQKPRKRVEEVEAVTMECIARTRPR